MEDCSAPDLSMMSLKRSLPYSRKSFSSLIFRSPSIWPIRKSCFVVCGDLRKKFICGGNVDVLAEDEELLRLSHDAGCIEWISGFETFSQESLNGAHKKTNIVEDYARAVKRIHKYKMAVFGTFVLGFDEDTPDVFQVMRTHIGKLGIDAVNFATPHPLSRDSFVQPVGKRRADTDKRLVKI